MKVLIIGISGLIGRWAATALYEQGCTIAGADLLPLRAGIPATEHYQCDLLSATKLRSVLQESAPDAVVHLAARTDLDETVRLDGYAANIDGVRNLVEAILLSPSVRRVIFTSSQLVCRIGHVPTTFDEYCPHTLYGESKVQTERIVRETDGGGVEWCLVRPTTVWGPYMSLHYQQMLRLIEKGRYFHCGQGLLLKSYSYAGNIAWQYFKLLTASADAIHRRTFYLADYEPLSLRHYADSLASELGAPAIPSYPLSCVKGLAIVGDFLNAVGLRRFPFNTFRLHNILTEYVFDLSATQAVCGPLPFTWMDGVKDTVKWFKQKGIS